MVSRPEELNVSMPEGVKPELWRQGIEQNPNPSILKPVVITGFDGLKERLQAIDDMLAAHNSAIEVC